MQESFCLICLGSSVGTCTVSQMFRNTHSVKARPVSKERESFLLSLVVCSLGTDSFPEGSEILCSENACYTLLLGFFGHQPVPLWYFFSSLETQNMYVITLLISSSQLGRYGACCLWLGGPSKAAFFSCWAGVLRALQKCTLPCSAAPRHLAWGTQASPSPLKLSSPCILLERDYALKC